MANAPDPRELVAFGLSLIAPKVRRAIRLAIMLAVAFLAGAVLF